MDFDHDDVRLVVNEDRLSSLPDELIHQILSCIDTKFAVQTCLLSPRWKVLWTSMPCLTFYSWNFESLPKFAKFVTNVLSRRNHQIEVYSVKLNFRGAASQFFVRKIANYAFSHNIQELTVISSPKNRYEFPPCLFSSRSLKHFTFSTHYFAPCLTPKTPWDFPALTTLHLSRIKLCDENTRESVDLFSKCVNLKNLTMKDFIFNDVEVFDIITPRLSSLILIKGRCSNVVNVIAPQLENLTIIDCSVKHLNAPPGISSFCYVGYYPTQLLKDRLHSLNKVCLTLKFSRPNMPYKEGDALMTISMLQELHSARYLTLNLDIVECLSSFPDLVSHHPSPFSDLICLNIDSSREEAYKVKMSTETRNFLLENSPNATFVMDLPEEPPTKAMKAKEARDKKKAKLISDISSHMTELQALLDHENKRVERKQLKEMTKIALDNLMSEVDVWTKNSEPERAQIEEVVSRLKTQIKARLKEMISLLKQENDDFFAIVSKKLQVRLLLEHLPKRPRAELETRYSRQLEETETICARLVSETLFSNEIIGALITYFDDNFSTFQEVSGSKIHLASSSSKIISTPSTSSINPMP